MSDVWVTSDTHFGHKNIITYENRPFKDTEEMDEVLIDNWNKVVKPNDLIFHLGDVFFCKTQRMEWISSCLNGRKILIRGNHDVRITNGKFKKLGFDVYNHYFYKDFLLSHYPQNADLLHQAYQHGLMGNIHGHVHSQTGDLDDLYHICVCTEVTEYKPINLEDLIIEHSM